MNIEEKLLNGNKEFISKMKNSEEKLKRNELLAKGQSPYALIICCSDSRVIPEEIFNVSLGEIFTIRSAGNVINAGELASIEYGIEHLHINYVLVLAHTSCGAIHASIHDEKGKYLASILDKIKLGIKGEKDERKASIINANEQVNYLKKMFPDYQGEIKSGLYDINNNEVIIF